MSGKTKIVVLHMREVIYTAIFLVLAVILAVVLYIMFGVNKDENASATVSPIYHPGVYTSSINLNDNTFDVEVTVDSNRIQTIRMVNLSESTTAMFPLMEPTLDALASQIYITQSVDNISYSEDNKYTSLLLLHAVTEALEKAEVQ